MQRLTGSCSFRALFALAPVNLFVGALLTGSFLTGCDVSNDSGLGSGQDQDPVVVDLPIAFVARDPLPYLDEDGNVRSQDILDPTVFFSGAQLIVKDRGQASAPERIVTEGIFDPVLSDPDDEDSELIPARYDIRDIEVSYDGLRILFAMRLEDLNPDDDEETTWDLWEYNSETEQVSLVLNQNAYPASEGHDLSPKYLPDGKIVFTSTRQIRSREILLDENKPQYANLTERRNVEALNLHVYDPFNNSMEQITFNPSHDLQPSVLTDGRIAFLRWDNASGRDALVLFTVNPDGSQVERLYGYNSQTVEIEPVANEEAPNDAGSTVEIALWNAKPFDDNRILTNLRARESRHWGGDLMLVDVATFIDNDTPNPRNPGSGAASARQELLNINIDENIDAYSLGGFYNTTYPVNDGTNRFLVSWSPCRLYAADDDQIYPCTAPYLGREDASPAAPSYGIWMLDPAIGTQRPIKPPTAEQMFTDVVVMEARPLPTNINSNLDDALKAEGLAVLHIRNIHDIDGALPTELSPMPHEADRAERPQQFIRLVKRVSLPDDEVRDFPNFAFGINNSQRMRDILGYIPIEPDGSAKFVVPPEVPFMVNLVDATGKRIGGRHNHWLSLKAGEQRDCVGCHEHADEQDPSHGRQDAELFSDYLGAPFAGIDLTGAPANPLTGQSMAEYYADTFGPRVPGIDLIYRDIWTADPAQAEADIRLRYADINPNNETNLLPTSALPSSTSESCLEARPALSWTDPASSGCGDTPATWTARCRITINYEAHIHPLWERDRRECDAMGAEVQDNTCTSCHVKSRVDAMGNVLPPAGNFILTGEPASPADFSGNSAGAANFITSYANLFYGRWEWEVNDAGIVVRRSEQRIVEVAILDANGDPVLDDAGNPTTRTEIRTEFYPVDSLMVPGRALVEGDFFDRFTDSNDIHNGLLSASELRLIAEWLDIGAQYYNSPFDAPEN